ncbi:MAG: phosphoribosylformylglycinamidine synthase subunit PurQ [Deltaproteobacteria bacterium]|jgi:phosphoribosylformylglycinamidine synthase|nr:phosphoribosylformylglycinamidine synthase subunit PurQ [Deltaproteobacteria bacterium]
MTFKTAVIVFPGSNCDQDCVRSWQTVTGLKADLVWHKESKIDNYDLIILPGGFSYGDYLRTGAIARFSPVMAEVIRLAYKGHLVIGICNGFQILTEAHLLPGALLRNRYLKYICKDIYLRVENAKTAFTGGYHRGDVLRIPISHGEGNYNVSSHGLKELQDHDLIVFRYCTPDGTVGADIAPNGSMDSIAGIINKAGNVLGLMPHPERVSEDELGGTDGRSVWTSILSTLQKRGVA